VKLLDLFVGVFCAFSVECWSGCLHNPLFP
jgi:hypothetical protein